LNTITKYATNWENKELSRQKEILSSAQLFSRLLQELSELKATHVKKV
jgi:hypothetical protein